MDVINKIFLGLASTAIVTFTAGYITTPMGQKSLEAVTSEVRVFAPIDVFAFSMLAVLFLAVAATRYPDLSLEEFSFFFVMLAFSSIGDILLQQRKFMWIMYVPCFLAMSLFLNRVSRLILAWIMTRVYPCIRTRVYPCIVKLFDGATNVVVQAIEAMV